MSGAADRILAEALDLSVEERLELASQILFSVEGPGDPDWESAWLDELDRRSAAADQGSVSGESWASVRERVLARLGGS